VGAFQLVVTLLSPYILVSLSELISKFIVHCVAVHVTLILY